MERAPRLYIEERDDEIVLRPLTPEYLDRMAGVLRGSDSLSGKLLDERQAERRREH